MLRGEVYWADLEPVLGREANKVRPVVIVSNNGANSAALRYEGVVTVVPLTSSVGTVHPFQALVSVVRGLADDSVDSKAQAEQVRSISVSRLRSRLGVVPATDMRRIEDALRVHLRLS